MRILILALLIYTFSFSLCFSSDNSFVLYPRHYFELLFNYVDSLPNDEITFVFLRDSTGFSSSNLLFTLKVNKVNRNTTITASDNAEFFFNYTDSQDLHNKFFNIASNYSGTYLAPVITHKGLVYINVRAGYNNTKLYANDYFGNEQFFNECKNPYPLPSGKSYLTVRDFIFRVTNPYFLSDRIILSGSNLYIMYAASVKFAVYNAFCENTSYSEDTDEFTDSYIQAYRTNDYVKHYNTYSTDLSDSFLFTFNVPISFSSDMLIIDVSKSKSYYNEHLKDDISALSDLIYFIIYYQYEPIVDKQYFLRTPFAQSECSSTSANPYYCFSNPDSIFEYGFNNLNYGIKPQRIIITSKQDDHQLGNIDFNKKPEFDSALFLELMKNSALANTIKSTYERTQSIQETLKLTKPLLDKALRDIPNEDKIVSDSIDVLNNILVSSVLNTKLIDNISTQMMSSGLFDNLSAGDGIDSRPTVDAIESLPDKLFGKGDISTVKDPNFDVGIDFDNKSKKTFGSLFDRINLPLMTTLKNSKIELANSSCSVSFYSFGRNVELSLCGFESQISFIGQLMVAFSTLTSILYVFRRDS